MSSPRRRRWIGWAKRPSSIFRPFPNLGLEQLEARETPATLTWTGTAGPNWSSPANWLGGVPTGLAANSEDLVFPATSGSLTSINDLPAGRTYNSITFSAGGYTLSGNAITLGIASAVGASGYVVVQDGAPNNRITFNTTLGAAAGTDQTFTIGASGAALTVSGTLTGSTGSTLTKDGVGVLTLTADNSGFTGQIKAVNNGGTLAITNAKALGSSTSFGATSTDDTTIGTNATLAVSGGIGPITEQLRLNGPGVSNLGALLNVSGNNTWSGPVILDTDSSIGASAGVLNITGVVSDTGAGHSLTKEGAAEVQLNPPLAGPGNSYQGLTTVNHGTLTVTHPMSLGLAGTPASGTLVNRTLTGAGQLRIAGPVGGGQLRILDEQLTLNGAGSAAPAGALYNISGNNIWAGPVILGSPSPNGFSVTMGVAASTSLIISGVISSPSLAGQTLTKSDTGRLIFNNANTYNWFTVVAAGALNIRDSQGLGTSAGAGDGTTVTSGAALELQVEADDPALNPRFDSQGIPPVSRDLWDDSVTHDANKMTFTEQLTISGRGIGNTGALRSVSGINVWNAPIALSSVTTEAAIGVDQDARPGHPTPDASYFTVDYSLTVNGVISGPATTVLIPPLTVPPPPLAFPVVTTFIKRNAGHLILTNSNSYVGPTHVEQGWVTIQNNNALGARLRPTYAPPPAGPFDPNLAVTVEVGDTKQPPTTVSAGASVHVRPLTPASPPLVVPEIITLSGQGPSHPYALISQKGALVSIGGANTWAGDVFLQGNAGIGVEQVAATSPLTAGAVVSELTVTGALRDGTAAGGVTKLGSRRLILQGEGTYTGANDVREGTLRVQNDTALGRFTSGTATTPETYTNTNTTVQTGAVIEFLRGITANNGGIASGVQVNNETLILNAPAQQVAPAGLVGTFALTYTYDASGSTETTGPLSLSISAADLRLALVGLPNLFADSGNSITVTKVGNTFNIVYGTPSSADINVDKLVWTAINGAEVTVAGGIASVVNLSDDNAWRGPVTLNAGTRVDVSSASRLSFLGNIDDAANSTGTSALVKRGAGELLLAGANTYRGATLIDRGVVTGLSSGAFGSATGGTTVANGAQLQLEGSVTIAGEPLSVQGNGWAATQLLSLGGASGSYTLTFLNQTTTSIPFNATAATVQSRLQSLSRVTNPPEVQLVTINGTGGTFTLTFNGSPTGAITAGAPAATATAIQTALAALPTIGAGNVEVYPSGGQYVVVFTGALAATNQPQITITLTPGSGLTGSTSTAVEGGGTGTVTVTNDPTVRPLGTKLLITFGGTLQTANLPVMTTVNLGTSAAGVVAQTVPLTTSRWFSTGPAPTNNGQTPLNLPTSGRITGIVTDPTDVNVIYVSTAGGGAWKTKNNGLTWQPLFDGPTAPPTALMYGGAITINVLDPRELVFATGDTNGFATGIFPLNGPQDNYAGSGVYRSLDSGATWTLLGGIDNPIAGQSISKVVFGAGNVFVATSTRNLVNGASSSVTAGVWRFNGTSWFNMTGSVSFNRGNTPGQAPYDPPPNGGGPPRTPGPDDDYRFVFPQTNATWSDLLYLGTTAGGTLYASLGESTQTTGTGSGSPHIRNGVFRTTDLNSTRPAWLMGAGGADSRNETSAFFGTLALNEIPRVGYVKISGVQVLNQPNVVYASVTNTDFLNIAPNAVDALQEIWRSADGGATWARLTNIPVNPFGPLPPTPPTANPSLGRYDHTLLVEDLDPRIILDNVPNTVYLAGFNQIFKTTDAGATPWTAIPLDAAGAYPANQYHAIALDTQGRLLTGSDGGIWRLDQTTGRFTNLNGTLAVTQLNSVDPHPTDLNRAVAGSQDNGTQIQSGNQLWSRTDDTGANLIATSGVVRYDPLNPNTIYAVRDASLRKTTDGGATWTTVRTVPNVGPLTSYYFPLVVDSQQTARILIGGSDGLQESTLGGAAGSYNNLNAPFINPVTAIAIATFQGPFVADPSFTLEPDRLSNTYDPRTIYVTDGSSIAVTKNRGLSWATRPIPTFTDSNFRITFNDGVGLDNADVPQITATGNGSYPFTSTLANGNPAITFPRFSESQTLTVVGNTGTYTLSYNGGTTPQLAFNASAATIQAALNTLIATQPARNEVQQLVLGVTATPIPVPPDQFTLTFGASTTNPLNSNATAAAIAAELNALPSISANGGFVTVTGLGTATNPYLITFQGPAGSVGLSNVAQLVPALVGNSAAASLPTVNTVRNGGIGTVTVVSTGPTGLGGGTVTDLAVDPSNRDIVYATRTFTLGNAGPTVFRSTDAGQTWVDISGVGPNGIPAVSAWKVVIDPRSNTLYVGNDDGVWVLQNASTATPATAVWSAFGSGMPRASVRDLVLNQSLNTLTAATRGRGAFQLLLPNYEVASGAIRAVSGTNVWTGPVVMTGDTSIGAAGTQQIQNGIAAASLNFLGQISDSATAPTTYTMTKIGAGTVILSGANTYTGQTLVYEGVLRVNNPRALGAATAVGNTIVIPTQVNPLRPNPSAALELQSDLELEPVVLNANGFSFNGHFAGALRNVSGVNTYTGPLTLNTNTTIGVDSGTTLIVGAKTGLGGNGTIGGGPGLGFDKEGTGTLVLANANTYDGLTRIVQGAIQLQHALGLGPTTVGTTVFDGAQLQLATPTTGPFAGTPVVTNEPLLLSGTGIAGASPFGTGALRNSFGNNTYAGPISLTITPNFAPPSNPGSVIAFGVDNAADNLTITGLISENNTPAAYLAQFGISKVGPGRLTLTRANQYNGVTFVRAGTLRVTNPDALGPVVSSEVQTINVIGITGNYQLRANNQTTAVTLPAGATALQVQNALNNLSSIGQNEVQTVTVTGGAGTFTLSFNGSTTGAIPFNASPVVLQGILNTLPSIVAAGGTVTVGGAAGAYTLTFSGNLGNFNQPQFTGVGSGGATVTTATTTEGSGVRVSETPTASGKVLTVSFSGPIGVGSTDVPQITSTNVSAGLLVNTATAQGGALGTVVDTGAALELDGSGGPLTLNEVLTINGPGVAGNGALTNSAGSNVYAGPITLGSDASVGAQAGSDLTITGTLFDPTPLTVPAPVLSKGGAGTVIFPNPNAYGGRTDVNNGVLRILNPLSLGGVGRNEQQHVSVYGAGNFTLTFNGQTTTSLAAGATAATVQTALNNLVNSGRQEIQTILIPSDSMAGFTMTFNGQTTSTLPITATAGNVQAALNLLPNFQNGAVVGATAVPGGTLYTIGFSNLVANVNQNQMTATTSGATAATVTTVQNGEPGAIAVTRTAVPGGFRYGITFGGALGNTNVPQVTAAGSATTVVGTLLDGNGPEVQNVQVLATNGSYSLTFNGGTTSQIAFNAPAAAVQTALNAVSTIGRSEIQNVQVSGTSGTFTLTFNGATTVPLAFNASAAAVQTALNNLGTIGGLDGRVTVTSASAGGITTYTVTFLNSLNYADQSLLVATPTGGTSTLVIPVQDGGGVTVTGIPIGGGSQFTVTFVGYLGRNNLPLLGVGPVVGAPALSFSTLQDGQQGTVVNTGGTLQMSGGFTMRIEPITLNGPGFNNQGALNNFLGNNTWSAPITLGSNASLGTTSVGDLFTITVPISDNGSGFGVDIFGPGTVTYVARVDNQYTGTTTVQNGTLLLDQPAGVAILGPLVVGGALTLPLPVSQPVVREARDNQVGTVPVTVNAPGLFDLNGRVDTIGDLTVNGGLVVTGVGGDLTTGVVAMTGGSIQVGDTGTLSSGNVSMTTGAVINAGAGTMVTLQALSATDSFITIGDNSTLIMTTVNTTNGSITVGDNGLFQTADITENGTAYTIGNDTTVTTGNITMIDGSLVIGNIGPVTTGNITMISALSTATVQIGNNVPLSIGNVSVDTSNFSVGTDSSGVIGDVTVGDNPGVFQIGDRASLLLGSITTGTGFVFFGNNSTLSTNDITTTGGLVFFGSANTIVTGNLTATAGGTVSVSNQDVMTSGVLTLDNGFFTLGVGTTASVTGITTSAGTINLSDATTVLELGGDINAAGEDFINGPGTLDLGGATRTITVADIAADDVDVTISAVIAGGVGAGVTKDGLGRLLLTGTSTFTGPLTISAGDVRVDGVVAAPVALDGGTLSGVGQVGGIGGATATVDGTVNPGDNGAVLGIGILSTSGPVTFGVGTTFFVDLSHTSAGAPVAGVDYDQLRATGNVDLGGATLTGSFGAGIVNADSFTILTTTGGTITGHFAEAFGANVVFILGHKFAVQYNADSVVLTKIKANVTVTVTTNFSPSTLGQPVTYTATVTAEPGSLPVPALSPDDTVTFRIGTFTSPPVQLDAAGRAIYTPPTAALASQVTPTPGSSTTLTVDADFSGDNVDFNSGTVSLTGGQTVLVPSIDPVATFVGGVPSTSPSYISPATTPGTQDTFRVTTTVHNEVATSPTPQTWTVQVLNSLNVVVWSRTQTGIINTSTFSFPVDATWGGTFSPSGLGVPDGVYRVVTSFTDNEWGNTGFTPVTPGMPPVVVVVDNTAPVIGAFGAIPVIAAPGTSGSVPTTVPITSTITETNLASWTITIRNSAGVTVRTITGTGNSVNQTWDGKDDLGALVPDDAYSITMSALDLAGNTATSPASTVVILKVPPTLTLSTVSPISYGQTITITAAMTLPSLTPAGAAIARPLLAGTTVTILSNGAFLGTGVISNVGGQFRTTFVAPRLAVGTYTLTATTPGSVNFLPSTAAAVTLTVTPATLTLQAVDATKVYGATVPPLTYTLISGLVPGDILSNVLQGAAGTTATQTSPVGTYEINQGTLSSTNYLIVFRNGTLTVTPAALSIVADDKSRPFGKDNPPLTFQVSGLLPFDTQSAVVSGSLTTAANATSAVGQYPITQGSVAANGNYTVTFTPGTLTVTPPLLRIIIDDARRQIGQPNPTFTAHYEGFLPGDGPSIIRGLSLVTTATQTSRVGKYPITAAGTPTALNYTVEVVPGTLTVTPLPADVAFGGGAGSTAEVRIYKPDGSFAYKLVNQPGTIPLGQGVRTAAADFDGDGVTDIVLGSGPGSASSVVIISGASRQPIFSVAPFEAAFTGGVFVSAGDIDGDGLPDLVISPDQGGGPRVQVYRSSDFAKIADFFGIDDPAFRGGARTAVGDIDNDGFGDLAVSAGFLGGPRVSLVSGASIASGGSTRLTGDFFIFGGEDATRLRNGVFLSVGDINGDGYADVIAGGGPGGGPRVLAVDGFSLIKTGSSSLVPLANFFGGDANNRGGIRLAVKDLDGDRFADLVVGAGDNAGSRTTWYRGTDLLGAANPSVLYSLDPFDGQGVLNGVFVG